MYMKKYICYNYVNLLFKKFFFYNFYEYRKNTQNKYYKRNI